jgi:hypothetical protein
MLHDEAAKKVDDLIDDLEALIIKACSIRALTEEGKIMKALLFKMHCACHLPNGSLRDDTDLVVRIGDSLVSDIIGQR